MFAYFPKTGYETSEAMKLAAKEAPVSGNSNFEKMKAFARGYSTKHECSVRIMITKKVPRVITDVF